MKKVRRVSALQRERAVARNKKVFWNYHKALVACGELDKAFFSYPIMGFIPAPQDRVNFGAMMANTRTHKRNNR